MKMTRLATALLVLPTLMFATACDDIMPPGTGEPPEVIDDVIKPGNTTPPPPPVPPIVTDT